MWILCLPLLVTCIPPTIRTTWVWGPANPDQVSLKDPVFRDSSFIRLEKHRTSLNIILVSKGDNWPDGTSFCTPMVSAAIAQFLEIHDIDLSRDIETVEVFNMAKPYIAGCKCYVRIMVAMGYNYLWEEELVESESDILRLCEDESHRNFIWIAHTRDSSSVRPPPTRPEDMTLLLSARIRNLISRF